MLTFLSSDTLLGWTLFALALATISQLPAITLQLRSPRTKQKMHQGQMPPSINSG
ncbi:MAG: hypothetical protein ABJ263_11710 [Tateyamaria sp.]|uniref:hypothetical protein n=1 Tax=Tateyamaria sp. TaxID=1929288 RepID=UPI00328F4170